MNAKGIALPIIVIVVFIALFTLAIASFSGFKISDIRKNGLSAPSEKVSGDPRLHDSQTAYEKVSGKLELLDQKLDLVLPYDASGVETPVTDTSKYYSAGVFESGKYKGYTRVIAVHPTAYGMGGISPYEFVTKDFETYIVNGDPSKADRSVPAEEMQWENPLYGLNLEKVTGVDYLPLSAPQEVPLDSKFGLHKDRWEELLIDKPEANDRSFSLGVDLTKYTELPSPNTDFKLYAKKPRPSDVPQKLANYIADETTAVYLVDSTGLSFNYNVTSSENNAKFISKLNEYKRLDEEYAKKQKEINERIEKHEKETGEQGMIINDYPVSPEVPQTPSLEFESRALTDVQTEPALFYEKYAHAFPRECAHDPNTYVVKNIKEIDLKRIAKISGIDVYTFSDPNHPVQKLAYQRKVDHYNEYMKDLNDFQKPEEYDEFKPPAYDVYIKSVPLVLMKDYWGRWVVLEEPNYNITGGCGKPVVYLYPSKPTDVTLKFSAPMHLETQIPVYGNGWKVKAFPDGTLVDLQPELTNCALLTNTFGAEYAQSACQKNEYPYIYWSGESYAANYPHLSSGWIVESREVRKLLSDKLTVIGLNQKEQNDMLEYWLPKIEKKNAPYYRITLLQNDELNRLFPMQINPKPDSVIRVFLDFMPLNSASEITIQPQDLKKYNRTGFTLVEWGGLNR